MPISGVCEKKAFFSYTLAEGKSLCELRENQRVSCLVFPEKDREVEEETWGQTSEFSWGDMRVLTLPSAGLEKPVGTSLCSLFYAYHED